jgi:hypothetical protein
MSNGVFGQAWVQVLEEVCEKRPPEAILPYITPPRVLSLAVLLSARLDSLAGPSHVDTWLVRIGYRVAPPDMWLVSYSRVEIDDIDVV